MVEWSAEKSEAELAAQEAAGVVAFDAGPEVRETAVSIYWDDLEALSPEVERLRPVPDPQD
ncbi:hypothetical protein [Roseovarius sp. SYSU LYC5161]|uniref:hypothetical protein n=1 Tax=Roseovarius halophilus (ex Wu et al. 2025) TaxID=3376060 RepID=UPI003999867D